MAVEPDKFPDMFAGAVEAMDAAFVTVLRCPVHHGYLEPSDRDPKLHGCSQPGCKVTVLVDEEELQFEQEGS
jgi:hypothetical protein